MTMLYQHRLNAKAIVVSTGIRFECSTYPFKPIIVIEVFDHQKSSAPRLEEHWVRNMEEYKETMAMLAIKYCNPEQDLADLEDSMSTEVQERRKTYKPQSLLCAACGKEAC